MIGIETYRQEQTLRYKPKIEDADNVQTFYSLRVGNQYYQGNGVWGSELAICGSIWQNGTMRNLYVQDDARSSETYDKFIVYVPGNLSGDVEIVLWPLLLHDKETDKEPEKYKNYEYFDMFYSALSIEYQEDGYSKNSKSSVEYKKVLNAFGEDKTINVSLMSKQRSAQGINYFLSMQGKPLRQIALQYSSTPTNVIPEQELLNKMEAYYSIPRNVIEMEVAPFENRMPEYVLLDRKIPGKTVRYKCLSESIDWRADTSTIQCFEEPY